uniref:Cadherin domain-containing protein n=1 Tax=Tanacetum cinerariifolium TaxID=118510 RepID=A0A6L2LAE4_TANCI|nr:hypothetical protein [Tanacetum cinerariifolium]
MEDTILELIEICRQKELLCMHDNVDDLIESALNSKLLSINSQHEIIKSGVEELVPILSENEVTSKDKRECDVPVCENSPVCDDHSEFFFDSKNNDDISSDDDDFEDIEYVEASLPDPEIVSVEEENDVHQEEECLDVMILDDSLVSVTEEFLLRWEVITGSGNDLEHFIPNKEEVDLEDIFQIQDVVLREKLLSINRLIANIKSLNDNPTPDRVLNSSVLIPIFEESDNSLSDNFSPEFETFYDHTEETRSGITTTHANNSLPEYDLFCFEIEPDQERLINAVKNDIYDDSSNDPLLEEAYLFLASDNSIPPGIENFADDSEWDIHAKFDFEPDAGEEILVVMNTIDELECLDSKDVIDVSTNDDDYSSFMFLIYSKMFLSFLSAKSEDTIFDPGKDYAQNVKNQSKARQYRTQDWKSTAKAGSTGIFLKKSSNEA